MLNECLTLLDPKPGEIFVDATLGLGGHAEAVISRLSPGGTLIGFDWDEKMLTIAEKRLKSEAVSVKLIFVHSDYRSLTTRLQEIGFTQVDKILFDLGLNSAQMDDPERGIAFRYEAPLDMRMDQTKPDTASDLLNRLPQTEIERILREYGEERFARSIAKQIVERRQQGKMNTTTDLVGAVLAGTPAAAKHGKIHPATRTFQAVRIAVNDELDELEKAIEDAASFLSLNGRVCALTYHSLEDRAVKHAFQRLNGKCECPPRLPQCVCGAVKRVDILTKKPLVPSQEEVRNNPRSRSAKLRAAQKIA